MVGRCVVVVSSVCLVPRCHAYSHKYDDENDAGGMCVYVDATAIEALPMSIPADSYAIYTFTKSAIIRPS